MLTDLLYILFLCGAGAAFAIVPILLSRLIAPVGTRNYLGKTSQVVECGMDPIGDAWIRFGVVYYLYGLIFIAFSVDVLYLLPVALVYGRTAGWRDLVELALFLGLLVLVLIYAWKKGVFNWKTRLESPKA